MKTPAWPIRGLTTPELIIAEPKQWSRGISLLCSQAFSEKYTSGWPGVNGRRELASLRGQPGWLVDEKLEPTNWLALLAAVDVSTEQAEMKEKEQAGEEEAVKLATKIGGIRIGRLPQPVGLLMATHTCC